MKVDAGESWGKRYYWNGWGRMHMGGEVKGRIGTSKDVGCGSEERGVEVRFGRRGDVR